jgi:tetratricopeptide (TPR) repeat protein
VNNANSRSKSRFIRNLLASELACADGRKLIELGEYASSTRAKDILAQVGLRLSAMPGVYSEFGDLFTALAMNDSGSRVLTNAAFEQLTESRYRLIRARALLALGSNFLDSGNSLEAVSFYTKAVEVNSCPLNLFCSAMMTVAAGQGGLDTLNGLYPLARYVGRIYPAYGFDYRNSVAVELNKAGHVEQAKQIIIPVITSPFAQRYPEWAQTAEEIAVERKPQTNVLAFRVDRTEQVRRIEKVMYNTQIDGLQLKRYADAGRKAIQVSSTQ